MPYWLYTSESLPNPELSRKPGYSPEILEAGYVTLPAITEGEWIAFHNLFARTAGSKEQAIPFRTNSEGFYTMRHRDWKDRAGTREFVAYSDLSAAVRARWGIRGVIVLDHEPTADEKAELEKRSKDANMAFRMRVVEEYENAVREKEVTGQGRTRPTPYEDECYTLLGLTKPYSVEAMRAQRHPGEAVGEQIVSALDRLMSRKRAEESQEPLPPKPPIVIHPKGAQKGV